MGKLSSLVNEEVLADFWYFVQERHNIWYRRFVNKDDRPWTKDKTLRDYFFTNVYRELDRGSLYLTEEILCKIKKPQDKLFNILIYRYFNHIPTYEFLTGDLGYVPLGDWRWKIEAKRLKKWKAKGNQVFTSAFTVTGNRFGGFEDKIDNVCWLIDWLQNEIYPHDNWKRIWNAKTMEDAFTQVKLLKGFGAFLAYEIVIDINYGHGRWGEDNFVNTGPGAYRGLTHVFHGLERRQGSRAIRWLWKRQPVVHHGSRLSLRNIEHSLCEYQKYVKRREGKRGGRARQFTNPSNRPLPGRR